jgi:riboflavin biosynthesis pyrimidine reductase
MWIPGGFRRVCPQSPSSSVDNPAGVWSAVVRQLLPTPLDDVDPLDLYLADDRSAPGNRPWLMVNMIAAVDGATAVDGLSGGLGGPADQEVFRAIRASSDWILVASATAAAESYRVPTVSAAIADRRVAQGRTPCPQLAIVTASGRVDPTIPALAERADADAVPLIIAGRGADDEHLDLLDAEVVRLTSERPEPEEILAELGRRGARVVLAEGGPRLNGVLHGAGAIDEFCMTLSPTLAGGSSPRVVAHAPDGTPTPLRLDRLLEHDDLLFARYVRA